MTGKESSSQKTSLSDGEPIYVTKARWKPLVPFAFFFAFDAFWVYANVFGPASTPQNFVDQPPINYIPFALVLFVFAIPTYYFWNLFYSAKKTSFYENFVRVNLGQCKDVPYSNLDQSKLLTRVSLIRWKSYKYFDLSIRSEKRTWEVDDAKIEKLHTQLFDWLSKKIPK
jgi:hypothetical protein